jgi:hypothetical protein
MRRGPWRQGVPKKKPKGTYLPFFLVDFDKIFFNGVFGLLMQRNGKKTRRKQSIRKEDREKKISTFFGQKVFDMDFPPKQIVVFLNSPC